MTGLALVIAAAPGARFVAGCELAASAAALGRPVAALLTADAVAALRDRDPGIELLRDAGVALAACQSAMDALSLPARDLPAGVEPLGLVAWLADHADRQLLFV